MEETVKRWPILLLILAGCTLDPQDDYQWVNEWVHDTIETVADDERNEFQSPNQTMARGAGDCEDFALLMLWRVWDVYGVRGEMVILSKAGTEILHAIVRIAGSHYDPTTGRQPDVDPDDIVDVWTYGQARWYAVWNSAEVKHGR